jgi:hypothetical protein
MVLGCTHNHRATVNDAKHMLWASQFSIFKRVRKGCRAKTWLPMLIAAHHLLQYRGAQQAGFERKTNKHARKIHLEEVMKVQSDCVNDQKK